MKIIPCPPEIKQPDFYDEGYTDPFAMQMFEDRLIEWLKTNGYPGPLTGEIWGEESNDGWHTSAWYMYCHAEEGGESVMIRMPTSEHESEDLPFFPPHEVERRLRIQVEDRERWEEEERLEAEKEAATAQSAAPAP